MAEPNQKATMESAKHNLQGSASQGKSKTEKSGNWNWGWRNGDLPNHTDIFCINNMRAKLD